MTWSERFLVFLLDKYFFLLSANFDLTLCTILLLVMSGPSVIMWVLISPIKKLESEGIEPTLLILADLEGSKETKREGVQTGH